MKPFEHESFNRISEVPKTSIGANRSIDLTQAEKQDITMLFGSAMYGSLLKLLELMLIEARDEAVMADPAKISERIAALDIAHAMARIYTKLKDKIAYIVEEQLGTLSIKRAQDIMSDQSAIEEILAEQLRQGR